MNGSDGQHQQVELALSCVPAASVYIDGLYGALGQRAIPSGRIMSRQREEWLRPT
ncbi:hypothetical protein [Afifella marina]|uniref:hypothetical protein n=1 Tax=Afifella marina TaxID=1080 RepID=UPI001473B2D5|nr:hypothetical protein [Afifella marina]